MNATLARAMGPTRSVRPTYPCSMRLEKVQGNALFATIIAGGLDPNECVLANDDDGPRITHLPSGSYFEMLISADGLYFTITRRVAGGPLRFIKNMTWDLVPNLLHDWAEEVSTPSFWSDLTRNKESLTGAQYDDIGNTPFTPNERAQISEQLQDIKAYVTKTYALTSEQASRLEARFDEAEAASRRIGRKDWMTLFYGTLFSLIVSGVLTPEIVQHLLVLVFHGLGHLFGFEAIPHLPPAT
jgi:hypothetical protein